MELAATETLSRFAEIQCRTERLCAPLIADDYGIQSMPDVSPPKWHLAHTSWFFEEFLLAELAPGYRPVNDAFRYLFNSYYEAVGPRVDRARRGLLGRPGVEEVYAYRAEVRRRVKAEVNRAGQSELRRLVPLLTLGCQHEEQHQELLLTDIQHIFWSNPLRPTYESSSLSKERPSARSQKWHEHDEGLYEIGWAGSGFAFDHEGPRHPVHLEAFRISSDLVSCGEFLEFINAGGYREPELWLSDGWAAVQRNGWVAPLYWELGLSGWRRMTLSGMQPIEEDAPVLHVSYYEADAFARWRGFRLPREEEWEVAATSEAELLQPEAWQWTRSAYHPYPGFKPRPGALGEYNGKFMCNQMVLRGGSRATPQGHLRPTYRNFFPPEARWQFSGIRLAA
jgi:ergothioneine biosynthesis protein EgtB